MERVLLGSIPATLATATSEMAAASTINLVYPLFERDALLDTIRKAPEFVRFMTELKATVDGYRRELEGR